MTPEPTAAEGTLAARIHYSDGHGGCSPACAIEIAAVALGLAAHRVEMAAPGIALAHLVETTATIETPEEVRAAAQAILIAHGETR